VWALLLFLFIVALGMCDRFGWFTHSPF